MSVVIDRKKLRRRVCIESVKLFDAAAAKEHPVARNRTFGPFAQDKINGGVEPFTPELEPKVGEPRDPASFAIQAVVIQISIYQAQRDHLRCQNDMSGLKILQHSDLRIRKMAANRT